MDFWMLTEKGKRGIFEIERKHLDDEGKIIKFLHRSGSASVETMVISTGVQEHAINAILKRLSEKSMVWRKSTRFTRF